MVVEKIKTQSLAMKFFRAIGLESIAWSLRRLHCPVDKNELVLEVGSGGNPYARANILLDAYVETSQRHWVPLKVDRPMVIGIVEKLPFKDNSFDFVIASHVLEHSSQPEKFLAELQRVAKAGYIEVPDAFMERINPYTDHKLEITCRKKKLIIKKKSSYKIEHDTVELYENKVKPFLTQELIPKRPFAFHVRYYWKDKIDFKVMNPDVDASWTATEAFSKSEAPVMSIKARLKDFMLNTARLALSQNIRNKKIDLFNLLLCPSCGSTLLSKTSDRIKCNDCNTTYQLRQSMPTMFPHVSEDKREV